MMSQSADYLWPDMHPARYGAARRLPLFLRKYLAADARDRRLATPQRQQAHEILCKWADIESSGRLRDMNETQLEGDFLVDVFGRALGYTLFSENLDHWNLQPKYNVNGGQADAAIGLFRAGQKPTLRAVIELKGPTVNLDRDRFGGRTAIQQCWDYLYALPDCPWGIVCNYVSFRLYHRNQTPRRYELFTLHDLRTPDRFNEFYCLFQRDGLLPLPAVRQEPRADRLLAASGQRQREVGDKLYDAYHDNRVALIRHLTADPHNKPLEEAIRIAQKLLDRIIFIAFCEDRDLLPKKSLHRAWEELPPFRRVTNPRWKNFLDLFHAVDKGNPDAGVPPFNGGLFRADPTVDNLELNDQFTDFFKEVGEYDFHDEINVDVLGHLFEKSVHDIEQIRLAGFFEAAPTPEGPRMQRSAERKRGGIYYTPTDFTAFICDQTVAVLADDRVKAVAAPFGFDLDALPAAADDPRFPDFVRQALDALRTLKIVDPACGSGAFLIQAYDVLERKYFDLLDVLAFRHADLADRLRAQVPDFILHENLHGVDLSPEAVEITQLALWLRSAYKEKTLADLSHNIVRGNSLVDDPAVHPDALDWRAAFPDVFNRPRPGFDAVIGNPPWERLKLQEREFFDAAAPEIAAAVNAAQRRALIARLRESHPELDERYRAAKAAAEANLAYARNSGRYPLTGKGDINTYALFAELAQSLVAPHGRVGLLVPSGIATDNTTRQFFATLVDGRRLMALYDFENKAPVFPDVHRSMKFSILLFGGEAVQVQAADFAFFNHHIQQLDDPHRHVALSADDINLLNPNTRTCPIFRSRRDADITKAIYRRVPVLVDKSRTEGGNPWGVRFFTMFHQTNDAELFITGEQLQQAGFTRHGPVWKKGKTTFLPLYEAKMVQMYDHRAASVVVADENWMRQGQTAPTSPVQHQNPEYTAEPRWWVDAAAVDKALENDASSYFLAYKDVTSPTNQRTMIAAFIPRAGVVNSAPLVLTQASISPRTQCCLLADLDSFVFDFVARQKVGGVHLNFFIVEQLPVFGPDFYRDKCPWSRRTTLEKWISDRVLKLTCTSNDMIPLARAAGFDPPVHKWNPRERNDLMAQLDAAYFLLYGIERDDVLHILSTFQGLAAECETLYGDSTVNLILRHYDALRDKSRSS